MAWEERERERAVGERLGEESGERIGWERARVAFSGKVPIPQTSCLVTGLGSRPGRASTHARLDGPQASPVPFPPLMEKREGQIVYQ